MSICPIEDGIDIPLIVVDTFHHFDVEISGDLKCGGLIYYFFLCSGWVISIISLSVDE